MTSSAVARTGGNGPVGAVSPPRPAASGDGRPSSGAAPASEDPHRTTDAVVVGGSLAGLVAADALGAQGRPVQLLLPARGVGGGFAAIRDGDRVLELGVRLLELGFEGAGDPPPLRDYRPGVGAHRPWARTVDRWVRGLVGDDLRTIAPPAMVLDGRRVPDLLFTVDLTGLATTLPDGLRRTMLREVRAARAALGDDAGLLAPRHADRLARATLADASRAQHGAAFHERYVAPLADAVLAGGAEAVAATLRRKVWAPIFHPATLAQALAGEVPAFRPDRPLLTVAPDGCGAVVQRLLARIATRPSVRTSTVGELRHVGPAPRDEIDLTFDDGRRLRARDPLIACSAPVLFAAAGVPYDPPRVRTCIAWVEADAEAVGDVLDLVHVLDRDVPLLRVSRGGRAATPDRALLTVELRHDVPGEALGPAALDGLRRAGLVGPDAGPVVVRTAARPTFPVPSHALLRDHDVARSRLDALGLHVALVAGAASPAADTLNDQVVQGLLAAERTR